jgi:hypothetical protein
MRLRTLGLHLDLPIHAVVAPTGRGRLQVRNTVKRLDRFFVGLVAVFKIVVLHLILNIRGVPHRISFGETVEDERDSSAMD